MQTDSRSPQTAESNRLMSLCATVLAAVVIGTIAVVVLSRNMTADTSPAERRLAANLEALNQTWMKKEKAARQRKLDAFQAAGALFTKKLVPVGTSHKPAPTGFAYLTLGMQVDELTYSMEHNLKEIGRINYVTEAGTLQEFELLYNRLDLPATDFYATLIERFGAPSEIGTIVFSGGFDPEPTQTVRWHWPRDDVDVILVVQDTGVINARGCFYPRVTFAKGRHARALAAAQVEAKRAKAAAAERDSILARLKHAQ